MGNDVRNNSGETPTLGYAAKKDVRRHPGPSDESIVRFFGWGMWIAIAIPFVAGAASIAWWLIWR
ncbi:MAG TPA: hypothetical protein P5081_06715 [Phycisphaerae bacterium]|nr:hypothetical protein [Phycisphaerae bacterium]HRW52563.1 hypothetical protein [Phycisphaerae bacterium]